MRRRTVLAGIVAGVVVAGGVGAWAYASSGSNRGATATQGRGVGLRSSYIDVEPKSVTFIQWWGTDSLGDYSGTETVTQLSGEPPFEDLGSDTYSASAQVSGEHVRLSLRGEDYLGTIDGDRVRYNVPQQGGTIGTRTLVAGTTDTYNSAVVALRQKLAADNQDYQDRLAQQQQAAAQQEAQHRAVVAATCRAHGGYMNGDACYVDYPPDVVRWSVPILPDGSFDQPTANQNRAFCADQAAFAQQAVQMGTPFSHPPQYHADSGICDPGLT